MDNIHDEEVPNDQVLDSEEEKQAKPKEHKLGVLSKRTSSQMNGGQQETHFKINVTSEKTAAKR